MLHVVFSVHALDCTISFIGEPLENKCSLVTAWIRLLLGDACARVKFEMDTNQHKGFVQLESSVCASFKLVLTTPTCKQENIDILTNKLDNVYICSRELFPHLLIHGFSN